MANKIDELNCFLGNGGNVGQGDCEFTPGLLIGHIYGPAKLVLDANAVADSDALIDGLKAAAIDDEYAQRVFPIKTYRDWAANGEAAAEQTVGDGTKYETRAATQQMDGTIYGSKTYHAAVLKTLHNKQGQLGVLDVYNQENGTYAIVGRKEVVNGIRTMGFFPLSTLKVSTYNYRNSTTAANFVVSTGYANAQAHDSEYRVMLTDRNPLDEITGLISVSLNATSSSATTIQVQAFDAAGIDLHSVFDTELASVSAFQVYNDDPASPNRGNAITVSSVASNATGWALTIAATGTDPDNPGSGKGVRVQSAAPSVWNGLDVVGYEGLSTRVILG